MKKSLTLLAAFVIAGMWSAPVQAADQYVSAFGGVTWPNGGYDEGFTGTAAIGCDYGDTRLEAEMGYQNAQGSGNLDDVNLYSLMANGYYDIDLGGVDFYLTAGVGAAQVETDPASYSEESLAYQFGAGLAVPVGTGVMLDARYRYFTTLSIDDWVPGEASSNSALLGLRVAL